MLDNNEEDFDVRAAQSNVKDIEEQYSGKIDDLRREPDDTGRIFVTKYVVRTVCIITIAVIGWGMVTGDFTAFDKIEGFIGFLIGGILVYYFKSG
jgi:hypothetical protein